MQMSKITILLAFCFGIIGFHSNHAFASEAVTLICDHPDRPLAAQMISRNGTRVVQIRNKGEWIVWDCCIKNQDRDCKIKTYSDAATCSYAQYISVIDFLLEEWNFYRKGDRDPISRIKCKLLDHKR